MKISSLKGVGEKTEQLFNRLSVYTTEDLLNFYPRNYEVYSSPVNITDIKESGIHAIYGMVTGDFDLNYSGKYKVFSAIVKDALDNRIKITWFNMPYLKNQLKRGCRYVFRGKVAFRGNLVFMEQPVIYNVEDYRYKLNSMQPIYNLTAGLTNNSVIKAVKQAFEQHVPGKEYLPENILQKCTLMGVEKAAYAIHFPNNKEELAQARKRMVFDEFFLFTTAVRSLRTADILENNNFHIEEADVTAEIISNLGYTLTRAQQKVYEEIKADMVGKRTMNRLIQGDVGSGKTILAFLAMINTVKAGFQAALMVPTEVLAKQHYEALIKLLENNGLDISCELLTGSLTAKNKSNIREKIEMGAVDIVIGTHALITDAVKYNKLALVVTDEQHRFGVRQREHLTEKGSNPHILVMSATPIPRSLAIILYGDLDISIIDEKPANRLPIKNCVVDSSYRKKAYKFIADEVRKGNQAYIICPMAEEGDNEDLENVVEYTDKIKGELPNDFVIRYLHGKMKPAEKNEIMESFGAGEINVLVSTTVIEVGINVPNATVIMIENAERFGLAGLHQLRGRVGRGNEQSYCILMSDSKNETTKERLQILKESNDGFYISEQDLKLRGPGDMLGVRQSGDMGFAIADIYADASVLKLASDMSSELLLADPELANEDNKGIKEKLKEYMNNGFCRINL